MTKMKFFGNVTISSTLLLFMLILLGNNAVHAQSRLDAKVYMTYADFVADKWVSVDSLVGGRTHQICQVKQEDYQFRIRTGNKEVDKILKQDALVVEYGGHLYVNCRHLRCNGSPLEVTNYTQAYRYDGNKLCVVSHWTNTGAALVGMAADVTAVVAPIHVSIPAATTAVAIAWNMDRMSNYRCYYLDSEPNAKGKTPIVRIDDVFMNDVLKGSPDLLQRYNALDKKRQRQSASNILPFLLEKGLIKE